MHVRAENGFTLLELLVAISVISVLLAISLPSLQSVRKHAEGVGCQSHQRQWGIGFTMEDGPINYLENFQPFLRRYTDYEKMAGNSLRATDASMYLCPSARRLGRPVPSLAPDYLKLEAWDGSRSTAWAYKFMGRFFTSSYSTVDMLEEIPKRKSTSERGLSRLPVLFDSTFRLSGLVECDDLPPQYDDMPRGIPTYKDTRACGICIARHRRGINILFMDASGREVGLKELWTLKWNDAFNTAGPWTRAGGVRPEDWPAWMRRFPEH